jgi:hypothetical protein
MPVWFALVKNFSSRSTGVRNHPFTTSGSGARRIRFYGPPSHLFETQRRKERKEGAQKTLNVILVIVFAVKASSRLQSCSRRKSVSEALSRSPAARSK